MEPNVTPSPILTQDASPLFGGAGKPSSRPFPNPFVGLRPFETNESLLFFGRSEQTVDLLQQLHRTRLLAVVGSSGCGKSSLIRAGLIPKLKAGFLVEDRDLWLTVTMKPGTDPLGNLAEALRNEVPTEQTANNETADEIASRIRSGGTQAILEHVKPALAESDANLLLLVDQFEEVFSAGDEAADFILILLALAEQTALPVYVVLTMRSDFWDRCEEFYGLPEAMNRSLYMVPRLTRQQRQQAIEGPIRLFRASLTARLLDRVLNDAGDQSDQLPVMQHALMRTWDEWRKSSAEHSAKHTGEAIDVCCYEAVGTIKEALSRDAEAALAGMTAEELKITERMFQALTDTDANNRRVRRHVHLNEIAAIAEADPDKVRAIIKRFTDNDRSFLIARPRLTADNPQIDISHESLIRQWEKLGEWMDDENTSREIYQRLANAAKRHKRVGAKLYSGADLREALSWLHSRKPDHSWARRYDNNSQDFELAIDFLWRSADGEEEESTRFRIDPPGRAVLLWMLGMVVGLILYFVVLTSLVNFVLPDFSAVIRKVASDGEKLLFVSGLFFPFVILVFLFRKELKRVWPTYEHYWLTTTKVMIGWTEPKDTWLRIIHIIPLRQIQEVTVHKNALGYIFNIGSIVIKTNSQETERVLLRGIHDPHEYAKMILDEVKQYEWLRRAATDKK